MEFKSLSMSDASIKMELWNNDSNYINHVLEDEFVILREHLLEEYIKADSAKLYLIDLKFGLSLYEILEKNGFRARNASNDNWWRYISLCVVPDLVAKRWNRTAENRFYKQNNRIWLKSIWWYIYLGWQGDKERTFRCLENNTTDQILQTVDRSGRKGYSAELFRTILLYFSRAKEKDKKIADNEFRNIMKLHTALCTTIEPEFYLGGIEGYVKMIYRRLNIIIGD